MYKTLYEVRQNDSSIWYYASDAGALRTACLLKWVTDLQNSDAPISIMDAWDHCYRNMSELSGGKLSPGINELGKFYQNNEYDRYIKIDFDHNMMAMEHNDLADELGNFVINIYDAISLWDLFQYQENETQEGRELRFEDEIFCFLLFESRQLQNCKQAKRFRNENGSLKFPVAYVAELTKPEADNYYTDGDQYRFMGKTYECHRDNGKVMFQSSDGVRIACDPDRLGTFLPGVASTDMTIEKISSKQILANLRLKDLLQSIAFEEIHLVHDAEETNLATIVELNKNTLLQAGCEAWKDVLNAKVIRIYDGVFGVQITCSGVEAQRLEQFSHMLAGNWPSEEFHQWVNDEPCENESDLIIR